MEHLAYYTALCGAWSGELRFTFTGRPEGLLNRVQAFVLGLLGHVMMHTTLAAVSDVEFAHTTRVRRFGLDLFWTEERFLLDPDGRRFLLRGRQWAWPGLEMGPLDGDGEASATAAVYRFPFLGAPMVQRTLVVPEGVQIMQTTSFSNAEVLLRRK